MASSGTYGVTNIPSIVTDAFNDAVGKSSSISKITTSNFVSCGQKLEDFDLLDGWYKSIAKRIIKVLFFAKTYNAKTRNILRDENTYGGFIEKLYTIAPDAVNNPAWQYAPDASTRQITQVSPYDVSATLQVKSIVFGDEGTWSYEFVAPMVQLKKAWQSPAEMLGFLDSQFIPVRNKIEKAKESVIASAINTSIARSLAAGKCINALAEYKNDTGDDTITTLAAFIKTPACIRYTNRLIKDTLKLMEEMNVNFNVENYETFSNREDLDIDILGQYASASAAYLESDTFHKELVALPGYNEVNAWQYVGNSVKPDLANASKIKVQHKDISNGDIVEQSGILVSMRDHENVAAYFGDEYEWSVTNVRQRVSNHGFQYNKGYAVNGFENGVVIYAAPVGTVTLSNSTHVTLAASVNGGSAYTEPAKKIKITPTIGEGYAVKKIVVTANSESIDITDTVDDDGYYYYTPNDTTNITITVTEKSA